MKKSGSWSVKISCQVDGLISTLLRGAIVASDLEASIVGERQVIGRIG